MPRAHPRSSVLTRPLPATTELALACTAFFLWLLGSCFQARIGTSLEVLKVVVGEPQWHLQWPLGPWLLGVFGLGLAYLQVRRGTPVLGQRLRQLSLLTGLLLLLRFGALWSPLAALFPFLGLLWSPHASWALAASVLLFPNTPLLPALSTRTMAAALLAGCLLGYSCWSLYFCQMTMLHGDEAHYLRVTQSLLHDGDMDLSNNLGTGPSSEFHVIDFPPHRAPASPPGRIHSVHPIGLSALMLPAYWTGLHLWANPRLAASLMIAGLSAGVVALAFLWLVHLGFDRWQALACALVGATTTPLLLYSTQLYPEIPALLVSLLFLVLLVHWQRPDFQYRALGRREPLVLAFLLVLLFGLLFLHPRYLPLALFLGAGVFLQVRHCPDPASALRPLALVGGAGGLALVGFNYAYSGDLFGPFLPGNAWEEGALQGTTWLLSLPGHWIHLTTGLLNSSPVFLASALGLALLVLRRRLQAWGALAFYLVTAGINGLHPDWTFGFCAPARYLLTALPVLLLGLAFFVREYGSRLPALFFLLCGLTLAYDSVITIAGVPEQAFGGNHLSVRTLNEFYPLDIHFFAQTTGDLPWGELGFWALLTAGLVAAALPVLPRRWCQAALLAAAVLPMLWGRAGAFATRLHSSLPPYLVQLNASGRLPAGVQFFNYAVKSEYQGTTGHRVEAGGYGAQAPADPAGILKSYYAPLIQPGIVTYTLSGIQAEHGAGQVVGHFSVAQRRVLPAIADWAVYHTRPIANTQPPASEVKLNFPSDHTGLAYAYVEFSGVGSLVYEDVHLRFLPLRLKARLAEVGHFTGGRTEGRRSILSVHQHLPRGYYQARYHLKGTGFSAFFQRKPEAVYLAVYADQNTPPGGPSLETQAVHWLEQYYSFQDATPRPGFIRPLVESIQAPWWTAVPVLGTAAYQVEFGLSTPQEVWLLFDYNGDAGLEVEGLTLYRMDLSSAAFDD